MVDFRAKPIDPQLLQSLIQAKTAKAGAGVQGLTSGISRGMQLAQSIGAMVDKKRQRDLIEDIKLTPEFQDLDAKAGGLLGLVAESNPGAIPQMIGSLQKQTKTGRVLLKTSEGFQDINTGEIVTPTVDDKIQTLPKPTETREDRLSRIREEAGIRADVEIEKQEQAQRAKKKDLQEEAFFTAQNKMAVAWANFQEVLEAAGVTEGDFGVPAKAKLAIEKLKSVAGYNQAVQDYEGALVEIASALAKLSAPSARVGQQIIAQFKKTLPRVTDNPFVALNQFRSSYHNATATVMASRKQPYTEEMRQDINQKFDDLFGSIQPLGEGARGSKQGGQLMQDAQGNKAIVYPDGSFEEVQ